MFKVYFNPTHDSYSTILGLKDYKWRDCYLKKKPSPGCEVRGVTTIAKKHTQKPQSQVKNKSGPAIDASMTIKINPHKQWVEFEIWQKILLSLARRSYWNEQMTVFLRLKSTLHLYRRRCSFPAPNGRATPAAKASNIMKCITHHVQR